VFRPKCAAVPLWLGMRARRARGLRTFTAARLDDEDILSSHTLLNLDTRLAALELVKEHLGLGYAEVVADGSMGGLVKAIARCSSRDVLGELRVRASAQDHNVPHGDGWWRWRWGVVLTSRRAV
jgi:hypothetical protein